MRGCARILFRLGVVLLVLVVAGDVTEGEPAASRAGSSAALLRGTASVGAGARESASIAWCGSGETPENRLPQQDPFSPNTIRVLYAFPSDTHDRFAELADPITAEIAAVDRWWHTQDPTREPRFDTYAFPGCAPGLGSLDLGVLPLAHDSAYYGVATGFERLLGEIVPHLGTTEKALVYLDAFAIDPGVCGVSKTAARNGGRYGLSVVSLLADCRLDLGSGQATARVAVHELVHNLGAVPSKAPGRCGDSALGGHTCDSNTDLMFPYASDEMRLAGTVLDFRHDDYYRHAGDWWDVRDSAWLTHLPRRRLTVAVTGQGSITSSPSAIACPSSCTAVLDSDFAIRLVAVAAPGAEFYGWRNACTGSGGCAVKMTGDRTVVAAFGPPRSTLDVRIVGRGRVVSTPVGIDCPGRCSARYPSEASVTLRARPAAGWRFARWSGECAAAPTCVARATADRRLTATFVHR